MLIASLLLVSFLVLLLLTTTTTTSVHRRFDNFDHAYLKPLLVRERKATVRGHGILDVYRKLMERDASEFMRKNGSFITSESFLHESASYSQLSRCVWTVWRVRALARYLHDVTSRD